MVKFLKKKKNASIELDELAKLILGGLAILILLYIVGYIISGELKGQGTELKGVFGAFK